jgi:hypothetical protein
MESLISLMWRFLSYSAELKLLHVTAYLDSARRFTAIDLPMRMLILVEVKRVKHASKNCPRHIQTSSDNEIIAFANSILHPEIFFGSTTRKCYRTLSISITIWPLLISLKSMNWAKLHALCYLVFLSIPGTCHPYGTPQFDILKLILILLKVYGKCLFRTNNIVNVKDEKKIEIVIVPKVYLFLIQKKYQKWSYNQSLLK